MGEYTSIQSCELEPIDENSFENMLDWLRKEVPDYVAEDEVKNYKWLKDKMLKAYEDCKKSYESHPSYGKYEPRHDEYLYDIVISVFDGLKLVGYWCNDFGYFIRDFAQFVEGELYLSLETNDGFAILEFEEGDVQIKLGEIRYDNSVHMSEIFNIPPLPEKELIRRQL